MKNLFAVIKDPARSKEFIKYTFQMAEAFNYVPYLLYVQNPVIYSMSSGTIRPGTQPVRFDVEIDKKNALKLIHEKIKTVREELSKNIRVNLSAEIGEIDAVINSFKTGNKEDMLVFEEIRQSGFWTLDTADLDIIQKVNCLGWIIPFGSIYTQFKKIIYATDYNEADIQTLNRLIELTKDFSPEITALHITGSKDFEEKTMQLGFEEMLAMETNCDNISFKSIIDKGDKSFGEYINDTAVDIQADLIVLLKGNRSFIEKIFKASSTAKIIKKARLPLLVFHENE